MFFDKKNNIMYFVITYFILVSKKAKY